MPTLKWTFMLVPIALSLFAGAVRAEEGSVTQADIIKIIENDLDEPELTQLTKEAGPLSSRAQWVLLEQTVKSLKNPAVAALATGKNQDPQVNLATQGYDFSFGASSPIQDSDRGTGTQIPFTGTINYFFYYSHICAFPKLTLTGRVTSFGDQKFYELQSFTLAGGDFWASCL